MLDSLIHSILYDLSYPYIFSIVTVYFIALYFIGGKLFLNVCKYLEGKKILQIIVSKDVSKQQTKKEIWYSLQSIIIFGLTTLPIIYLSRIGFIQFKENTLFNVLIGLLILNLWNEVHFFVIHKLMHLPFFMKHVHKIHHSSYIPTVYSVFSFHWFEAFLLSTLPISIIPFIQVAPLTVFLYPICSILINFSGHCNYRFGTGKGSSWKLLSSNHNNHHYKAKRNFGFAVDVFDKIFNKK